MARDRKAVRHRTRALALYLAALAVGGVTPASAASLPKGHDVSSHQKNVDWQQARAKGAGFVYVKATESTNYRNPQFGQQYNGARDAGIVRGAYHFALPDKSSGSAQAAYFVRNGGAWSADGWTLPPALDIEYNPYDRKHKCYGLSKAEMVGWIRSFSDEVKRLTGRRPVIYTTAHWWNTCTRDSGAFASHHALWVARYHSADAGALPVGWTHGTIWQYDDRGSLPGDQNLFNGSARQLKRFAAGS
jgi:lysozyme